MSLHLKPLEDQVIVITGASSGIGLETAKTAAKRGAKVVLGARSEEKLDEAVAEIRQAGGQALAVPTDVASRTEVERLANEAIATFGHIDTWINDAGVAIYGRLDEVSDDDARRLFDVNYWGVVNGSLAALPHLKISHGALINIGSEASEASLPLLGTYAASKHAVKGFTDALRIEQQEVDKAEVSITLIQPTATDTPFPHHAKNYMPVEPKLPDPMIDAHQVAEAILDAATHPMRDVTVGLKAKMNTFIASNFPAVADKMARSYDQKQRSDEPARNPEGTLHTSGDEEDAPQKR
jgi:short-subunit dehydrogenase